MRVRFHRGLVTKLRLKPPSDGPATYDGEPSLLGGRSAAAAKTASKTEPAKTCVIRKDMGFRRCLVCAVFVALAGLYLTRPLQAQTGQPIYPGYDGFIKNPDGTLTLSFAYFSHNAEPVTIPPGSNNSFAPDPADRLQMVTFLPGHHRFQCIMVVGPDFEGKLRWTLSYAGTTTSTSENMLQYSWELDEGAGRQAMRAVDPASAPRGVCLNRPAIVRVLGLPGGPGGGGGGGGDAARRPPPSLSVTLPEELRLFGSVDDEGLPRGAKLTVGWKMLSGPGTVTFSDPNTARTRASFSAPGAYQLELWASDAVHESRTHVNVTVNPAR